MPSVRRQSSGLCVLQRVAVAVAVAVEMRERTREARTAICVIDLWVTRGLILPTAGAGSTLKTQAKIQE